MFFTEHRCQNIIIYIISLYYYDLLLLSFAVGAKY